MIMSWRSWFYERWGCSDKCHDMCDEKFSSLKLLIQHAFAIIESHCGMECEHIHSCNQT
jgi:hypothetical protein